MCREKKPDIKSGEDEEPRLHHFYADESTFHNIVIMSKDFPYLMVFKQSFLLCRRGLRLSH